MSNISRLTAQKEALLDEMQAYAETKNFSVTKFNKLEKAIAEVDEQVKAAERAQNIAANRAQPVKGASSINEFSNLGEQMQSVAKAVTTQVVDNRLVKTGLSETDPSYGGWGVAPDFANTIWTRVYDEGEWLKRCAHASIGTNSNSLKLPAIDERSRKIGSQFGGVVTTWLAEAETINESQPKTRLIEFDLKKLAGVYTVTDELLADSQLLSDLAARYFGLALEFQIENAVVRGTGAGQPLGILNSPALLTVAADKGQAAKTITFNNVLNMISHTWGPLSSYCWYTNIAALPAIFAMSQQMGTAGQSIFFDRGGSENIDMRLFGLPLIVNEQSSDLGSTGDLILANMDEYMVVDKQAPQFASSMHIYFLQDKCAFRLVARLDGQPLWNTTLEPAQGESLKSPFITLAAR